MTKHRGITGRALCVALIVGLGGCNPHSHAAAPSAAPAQPQPPPASAAAPAPPAPPPAPAVVNDGPLSEISGSMAPAPTQAGDLAGSHAPTFLKRFAGSKIISYETLPFDQLSVGAPDPNHPNTWVFSPVEGQITRIVYQAPVGHTVLELIRNYESALQDAGFTQQHEASSDSDVTGNAVYHQSWETDHAYMWNIQQVGYVTEAATSNGKRVVATVFVGTYTQPVDVVFHQPVHFEMNQPFVIFDMVVTKAVANEMVAVKAADMADALASKGFVDLYGIYFDTDRTQIKPESAATLGEVASLLKIDRSLKLEVSGHTDNAGPSDHNLKLSQARAQAVVQALVAQYGIDAGRLSAKGYGDTRPVAPNTGAANMAKNRRVELRKL